MKKIKFVFIFILTFVLICGALPLAACEISARLEDLKFTLINNDTEYEVSRGNKYFTMVSIPSQYKGLPVTSIGACGFEMPYLTKLWIPDSIKNIGNSAFRLCEKLTSIRIPDSVTTIGQYAFAQCRGLTYIKIPDSVENLGNSVFYGCSSLTHITIPDTITSIGINMFMECSSLTSIIIPDNVTIIGSHAFFGCSSLTSIIIPDNVKSIDDWAFYYCTGLESIIIPDNVTSIGDLAFTGCSGLTGITIPNNVKSIGQKAFSECTALTDITISESVTSIGVNAFENTAIWNNTPNNNLVYADKWVLGYKGLLSGSLILAPDTIGISDNAFYGCSGLTSVIILESLIIIGSFAFFDCSGLTSITIPSNIKSIRNRAFVGCPDLTMYAETITISYPNEWYPWGYGQRPTIWGCTLSDDKTYVVSFIKTESSVESRYVQNLISAPYRNGYNFGGWATVIDGEKVYEAADINDATNGTTLYAIWV